MNFIKIYVLINLQTVRMKIWCHGNNGKKWTVLWSPLVSSGRNCDSKFWLLSFREFFSRDFTILLREHNGNQSHSISLFWKKWFDNFHFLTKITKICYGTDFLLRQYFEKNIVVVVVGGPVSNRNSRTS